MHKAILIIFIASSILPSHTYSMDANIKESTLRLADNQKDEFLFRAVLTRDLVEIKHALKDGACIEARTPVGYDKGKTPLALACTIGDPLIVQHLLSANADPNTRDDRGLSPLYHALQQICTPACIPMIDALVRNGADIGIQIKAPNNTINTEGSTPLHRIAEIMSTTRFGDKDKRESYDIRTAEEIFNRLQLILTIMVKEIICQSYREDKPYKSKLQELFAKKDAHNKAAYQLFEKYDEFAVMLQRFFVEPFAHPEVKNHDRYDKLDFKLCVLLHPDRVWQYDHSPFNLNDKIRKERAILEGSL